MATATDPAEGTIVKDAELRAINSIVKQLNAMNAEERERVVAYILRRFCKKPEVNGQ